MFCAQSSFKLSPAACKQVLNHFSVKCEAIDDFFLHLFKLQKFCLNSTLEKVKDMGHLENMGYLCTYCVKAGPALSFIYLAVLTGYTLRFKISDIQIK